MLANAEAQATARSSIASILCCAMSKLVDFLINNIKACTCLQGDGAVKKPTYLDI